MNVPAKKRLGELLIDAGIIDETQLKAALGHQRQWGIRLGQALVDLHLASEHDVVQVLAKRFGFEVARLDQVEAYAHQQAVALVPRDFALQHNVFPLAADSSMLSVAMSDPTNLAVVDELRFRTGRRVKVSIGGDREVAAAVQAAYPSPDAGVEAIALDVDEGDSGEPVLTSFGGGSSEDFESLFGADAAHTHAPPPDGPFAAGPAPAPVPAPVPAAATRPAPPAAARAPAPAPPTQPAAAAPRTPAAAPRPAPAAPQPAVAQGVPRQPHPAQPAARASTAPAVSAVPAPAAAAPRPAAPASAVRPAPAVPAAPRVELEEEPGGPPPKAAAPARGPAAALTPGEQAILAALQRLAEGGHAEPEVLKPTQAIAVLIRILLRKGVVSQRELLDALGQGQAE